MGAGALVAGASRRWANINTTSSDPIDRPLTDLEMRELRAISTRATISRTSFSNYYTFGDLK